MKKEQIRDNNGRYFSYTPIIHTVLLTIIAMILALILFTLDNKFNKTELYNPLIWDKLGTEIIKPVEAKEQTYLEGEASWYGIGENECLGCNVKRIMANGQKLDDNKNTVACGVGGSCKVFPLGSKVKILNLDNNMITSAVVTDTGGFTRYGRILDVSKAVRDHLNMRGLANVRVTLDK